MLNRLFRRTAQPAKAYTPSVEGSVYFWEGGKLQPLSAKSSDYALTNLTNWTSGGRGQGEWGRTAQGYAEAYMTVTWAYRAINIRAQMVGSILHNHGRVYDKQTGKPVDRHPLYELIDAGFKRYRRDVFEEWERGKCITGEAYIQKVSAQYVDRPYAPTFPLCFRALNPLAVEPQISRGKVVSFWYSDLNGGSSLTFEPAEIIYDTFPNPLEDLRGYSILGAALDGLNIERGLLTVTRAMLKNNMRPGIVFTPKEGNLTETDKSRIKTEIQERGKGAANAGRPLFIPLAMDIQTVPAPPFEDQTFLSDGAKRRILSAIGIPAGLVDHTDSAYQLSAEQKEALYKITLLPEAHKIARSVDIDMLGWVDSSGNTEYKVDEEAVLASIADPQARVQIVNSQFGAGYITFNQALTRQQLPPVDGGDFYIIQGKIIPQSKLRGVAEADKPEVFGYHIDAGILTKNEVRASLGYPPKVDTDGEKLSQLQSKLTVMQAAVTAGIPPSQAAQLVGLPIAVPDPTQPSGMPGLPGFGTPPLQSPNTPALPSPTAKADPADAYLHFGEIPDLVALQNQVKQFYGNMPVTWHSPADFGIELLQAPAVTAYQLSSLRLAIDSLDLDPLELAIGSLRPTTVVGQYPVAFRITKNASFEELRSIMAELCQELGIGLASFSEPKLIIGMAQEKPAGFTYHSKIRVSPQALVLRHAGQVVHRRPFTPPTKSASAPAIQSDLFHGENSSAAAIFSTVSASTGAESAIAITVTPAPEVKQSDALDELEAWRKKVANKGASAPFTTYHIRATIAATLRTALSGIDDKDTIKSAFQTAQDALLEDNVVLAEWPTIKAYPDTRAGFVSELLRIIAAGQASESSRQQFAGGMRAALRRYGLQAFRDGMNAVGYDPESLSAEELATFRDWQSKVSGFVANFGTEVFKQGITEAEVTSRANLWADVSLKEIYIFGVAAGNSEQRVMWDLDEQVEDHCDDCPRLAGHVRLLKYFLKINLYPGSGRTQCKLGCKCRLVVTDKPVTKAPLPIVVGKYLDLTGLDESQLADLESAVKAAGDVWDDTEGI